MDREIRSLAPGWEDRGLGPSRKVNKEFKVGPLTVFIRYEIGQLARSFMIDMYFMMPFARKMERHMQKVATKWYQKELQKDRVWR